MDEIKIGKLFWGGKYVVKRVVAIFLNGKVKLLRLFFGKFRASSWERKKTKKKLGSDVCTEH